jgi:hypothetical protein
MSKSAVSKMLNGQSQTIINKLPKLASLLECSIEDFLHTNTPEEIALKSNAPLSLKEATTAKEAASVTAADDAPHKKLRQTKVLLMKNKMIM